MIAKCAQQRMLFDTRTKRLSIKSANAPSQTRVPPTATSTTAAARTRVPRDEQWASRVGQSNANQSINQINEKRQTHPPPIEKKKEGEKTKEGVKPTVSQSGKRKE